MKHILVAALLTLPLLFSCSKDDEISKPIINILELGANNSGQAHIGGHLHLEAEIVAAGKIANIRVLIHQEDEDEKATLKAPAGVKNGIEFKIDSAFTGVYKGVKNTTFHEHLEIPSTALPGVYHLHMYVTDQDGNQSMIEKEVTFIYGIDDPEME